MAHAIEERDEVYCFARHHGTPPGWHGLGQEVFPSREDGIVHKEDMIVGARLDWHMDPVKVYAADASGQMVEIPNARALRRNVDGKLFPVVTHRYTVHQHKALAAIVEGLVEKGLARWETCGSLEGGERVFYTAKLNQDIKVLPGDTHDLYVTMTTSYGGMRQTECILGDVRPVCQNTLSQAIAEAQLRHMGSADDAMKRIEEFAATLPGHIERLSDAMCSFTKIVMNEKAAQRFLDKVVPVPEMPEGERLERMAATKAAEVLKRITYERELALRTQAKIQELHDTGEGANISGVAGTGYGWLNAVTNYATHIMRSKSKVTSVLVGDAAKMGRRAFGVLASPKDRAEILDRV